MGEMADYYREACIESMAAYDSFISNPYWIMENGKQIFMDEMSDEHLANCIALREKKQKTNDIIYKCLIAEQNERKRFAAKVKRALNSPSTD